MRIAVAGGGPAGLYFAALMAQSGGHEIEVFERNPPNATYGWGVVFSEGTLNELSGGHDRLFADLDQELVRWSTIVIHRPGSTVRARGQPFAAIDRKTLLSILHRWTSFHGLAPRFSTEFQPGDEGGFDLVVAADGVNSVWRRYYPEAFRPAEVTHSTRYIWLGIKRALPSFTFAFQPTPAGWFQAHAYPYGPEESTFIVETTEQAFRGSELYDIEEAESIRFCEKLFADFLDGTPLRSNRSEWLRFTTLRNQSWFRLGETPVVLVGDAAHTAHFSIGSGTKLAMEDAAALSEALVAYSEDLATALATYENNRQGPVARFQDAALDSARYFEDVSDLMRLPPATFAFNLVTRSGRVSFVDVEKRDPELAADVGRSANPIARPVVPALSPLQLGPTRFPNRLVGPGGFGLSPPVAINLQGRRSPDDVLSGDVGEDWEGVTLGHAGPRASCRPAGDGLDRPLLKGGWETIACSPIPYTEAHRPPREMSIDDMDAVVADFVSATQGVKADLLLIDASRGNLLASFLSPLTNRRQDEFGGAIENRLRYPMLVLQAVKEVWDRTLGFRFSATDFATGGTTRDDAVTIAAAAAGAGAHFVEVCGGGAIVEFNPPYRRGYLLPIATIIRLRARVPVLVSGGLITLDDANTAIGAGRADLIRLVA